MKYYLIFLLASLCYFTACQNQGKTQNSTPATETTDEKSSSETTTDEAPKAEGTTIDTENRGKKLLMVSGTEPFWGLEIASKTVMFYSLGTEDTLYFNYTKPIAASGRTADFVQFYEFDNGTDKLVVSLKKAQEPCSCSDGMSDNAYPYHALLYLSNKKGYEGCGRNP